MQYNYIFPLKKTGSSALLQQAVKVVVFLGIGIYIAYSLSRQEDLNVRFLRLLELLYRYYSWLLVFPALLFIVNWSVEAVKWRYLIRKVEALSFIKAFEGILTGVALGLATPLGLGDYAGRILQLRSPERSRAIGAVWISRMCQLYITLLWGSISLVYYSFHLHPAAPFIKFVLLSLICATHFIFLLLFFRHAQVPAWFARIPYLRKVRPYIEIISAYTSGDLVYILILSLVRYAIFSCQFAGILYLFGVSQDIWLLFAGIGFIFLIKSVVPTFFDLGVREGAAMYFFSGLPGAAEKVLFASLSIWLVNIILPALLGIFLIFRVKLSSGTR